MIPLKRLRAHHYRAMALRLQGLTLPQIAKAIGKSEKTVSVWFGSKEQVLFRREFERLQEEVIERTKNAMLGSADKAASTLVKLLDHVNGSIRLNAAKELLDRTGFKPEDTLYIKGELPVKLYDFEDEYPDSEEPGDGED